MKRRFGDTDESTTDAPQQTYTKFVKRASEFHCTQTPVCSQGEVFASREALDQHWEREHNHVCSSCFLRVRQSRRMLDLHVCEVHDSYFAVLPGEKVRKLPARARNVLMCVLVWLLCAGLCGEV